MYRNVTVRVEVEGVVLQSKTYSRLTYFQAVRAASDDLRAGADVLAEKAIEGAGEPEVGVLARAGATPRLPEGWQWVRSGGRLAASNTKRVGSARPGELLVTGGCGAPAYADVTAIVRTAEEAESCP